MRAFDQNYCIDTFRRLLAADSTTGHYELAEAVLRDILA